MTPDQKSAFILSQIAMMTAEREVMLAEELWTKDPAGTHYKPNCRLRFVSVLGLTEKRTA